MIHMNGRVYDPEIGRFISADPFIQAPLMSQSLNRYSYVMNNPLSLIDPSGYSWLSKAFRKIFRFENIKHIVNYFIAAGLAAIPVVGWGLASAYIYWQYGTVGVGYNYGYGGAGAAGYGGRSGGTVGDNYGYGGMPISTPLPPGAIALTPIGSEPKVSDRGDFYQIKFNLGLEKYFHRNKALKESGGISVEEVNGVVTVRIRQTVAAAADSPDVNVAGFVKSVERFWNGHERGADGKVYALIVDLQIVPTGTPADIVLRSTTFLNSRVYVVGEGLVRLRAAESQNGMAHEYGHVLGFIDWYDNRFFGSGKSIDGFGATIMGSPRYGAVHAWDIAVLAEKYR